MHLDLPVFERSPLRRAFYYFLVFNLIVCVVSISLVAVSDNIPGRVFLSKYSWSIMAAMILLSFAFTARNKKQLKAVLSTPDFKDLVLKYEGYYKRKLLWNGFSIVASALYFIITTKDLFFYILIVQLLLSLAFYPTKKLITRELNKSDIIFT